MRASYHLFFALVLMAGRCNSQESVSRIEFTTMTRGYQKQVFITADSLTRIVEGRQESGGVFKRATGKSEWEALVRTLADLDPAEMEKLPSPTNRRTFDGARHSVIKIVMRDGKEYQHGFDDEDPHAKLKPLMQEILRLDPGSAGR